MRDVRIARQMEEFANPGWELRPGICGDGVKAWFAFVLYLTKRSGKRFKNGSDRRVGRLPS